MYTEANYLYFTGQDTNGDGWIDRDFGAVDIGSDIAGTSYDVAHVQWGGLWVMPSRDRLAELKEHCTREWTTVNGVNGTLVTGPSGGQFFLPAAGYRTRDYFVLAGSEGYYWSSTLSSSYSSRARYLYFYGSYPSTYYGNRRHGRSVRPVTD